MQSRSLAVFTLVSLVLITSPVQATPQEKEFGAEGHGGLMPHRVAKPLEPSFTERFGLEFVPVPTAVLGPIDVDVLLIEDEQTQQPAPYRFGIARAAEIHTQDGQWLSVPGGWVWRVQLASEGAYCARLHLKGLALDEGDSIFLVTPSMADWQVGPLTGIGPFDNGEAWGLFGPGSHTRLEWFHAGNRPADRLPFGGIEYCHGYRDVFPLAAPDGGLAGGCELQPACYTAWANESSATVKLVYGGGALCSGQLVATTTNDQTPYCSTANHCVSTQTEANSMQFVFFNRASTCGGANATGTTVTGSDLTDSYSTSDCTLLTVRGEIPATTWWVGWITTNPATSTASTCLHHPSGAAQAISFGTKTSTNNFCGSGSYWSVVSWNNGVTEPGSSGSGIYRDSDHKMFGVLTCGGSSCSQTSLDDGYGRWDSAVLSTGGNFAAFLTAGSDDTQEQNDTCATAKAITTGALIGLIVKSTDEDWYSISIPTATAMTFALVFNDNNGDIDMQLYNSCGGTVVASQAGNASNESLAYTNTGSAATYYLRVFLYSDTRNEYTMTSTATTPAPSNDNCSGAIAIGNGAFAFNTTAATTSTPTLPTTCNDGAGSLIYRDVWYRYTATCAGTASASTCGAAAFDTRLTVYTGAACPTATTVVVCKDNTTGCASNTTTITWPATAGSVWYIRVGAPTNVGGLGTLTTSCTVLCPNDIDGSGSVDGADLAALLSQWGGTGSADVNGDGTVNGVDLGLLLAAWGPC